VAYLLDISPSFPNRNSEHGGQKSTDRALGTCDSAGLPWFGLNSGTDRPASSSSRSLSTYAARRSLHYTQNHRQLLHYLSRHCRTRGERENGGWPLLSTHMVGTNRAHLIPVRCLPQSVARARGFIGAWGAQSQEGFLTGGVAIA
jgi:hypothetical protein